MSWWGAEVPEWLQYSLPEVTDAVLATAKLRPAEQAALLARAAGENPGQAVPRYPSKPLTPKTPLLHRLQPRLRGAGSRGSCHWAGLAVIRV